MAPDTMVAQVAAKVHWNAVEKYGQKYFIHDLEKEECIFGFINTNQEKMFISNKTAPVSESKSIATEKEWKTTLKIC